MKKTFEERLCEILVKSKVITQKDAIALHKGFHGRSKETFDTFLLSEGIVQKKDLLNALSHYYEVPSFDTVGYLFERNLLMEFPQDVLLRHAIIPLKRDGDFLIIVASRPDNEDFLPELAEFISDDIQFYVGIHNNIVDSILEHYSVSPFAVDGEPLNSEEEDLYEEEDDYLDDMFNDEEDEEELFF